MLGSVHSIAGATSGPHNRNVATRPLEDLPSVARRRLVRLLHRELRLDAFLEAADHELASVLPYDSSCWLSLDPATLLPTGHFTSNVDGDHLAALAANEFLEDDVNKFASLAGMPLPVGILSAATGGDLSRSPRYSALLADHGYRDGDELRATFLDGGSVWGCLAVHRRVGRFTAEEGRLVGDVAGYVASGIRRAILRTALQLDGEPDPPGLIVLGEDGAIESVTPPARNWLDELFDSTRGSAAVPLVLASIAHNARQAAAGRTEEVATLRLPRRSGGWMRLDASLLDDGDAGRVAVIVGPSREPEVATLIAEAYRLSKRERDVTGLVLRGRSTEEMAELLHLSAYTVQDHLKSIFEKVGVRSRRELVAQLFLQQSAPRLRAGAPLRSDGWFAGSAPVEPRH
jgi:DNA-binding CsgD family transcriptional regulator